MTFIRTIPPEEATGTLREQYDRDLKANGYVTNYTQALSLRPEVLVAWRGPDRCHPRQHGSASLRTGDCHRRLAPALQLLNSSSRGGASCQVLQR